MNYLIIDIGNTNIVLAVFDGTTILKRWRISSFLNRTSDEYIVWLKYIQNENYKFKEIIIGSVVPDITQELKTAIINLFKIKPLIIADDIKVNFPTELDVPSEIGTDRIVNALCAWRLYQKPSIIIDFGTATTFDVVGKKGIYLGGVIAPGVNLSINALQSAAARLPRIAITKQDNVIGKNTVSAMSSGIYWGYIGLIKNILLKIEKELNYKMLILATGGLSDFFSNEIAKGIIINKDLTLKGLYMAYHESKTK
jgi:type III pantothenate kinase